MNFQTKCKYGGIVFLGLTTIVVMLRCFPDSIWRGITSRKPLTVPSVVQETRYAGSIEEVSSGIKPRWIGLPVEIRSSNIPVFTISAIEGVSDRFSTNTYGVIVALWQDGRVIWSRNDLCGGPVYYEGQVTSNDMEKFLHIIVTLQDCLQGISFESFLAPYDFPWTVISINVGAQPFQMMSPHEFLEQNTNRVATISGYKVLKKGESIESVLAEQPLDYVKFRIAWKTIRDSASALEKSGKPVAVNFEYRRVSRSR